VGRHDRWIARDRRQHQRPTPDEGHGEGQLDRAPLVIKPLAAAAWSMGPPAGLRARVHAGTGEGEGTAPRVSKRRNCSWSPVPTSRPPYRRTGGQGAPPPHHSQYAQGGGGGPPANAAGASCASGRAPRPNHELIAERAGAGAGARDRAHCSGCSSCCSFCSVTAAAPSPSGRQLASSRQDTSAWAACPVGRSSAPWAAPAIKLAGRTCAAQLAPTARSCTGCARVKVARCNLVQPDAGERAQHTARSSKSPPTPARVIPPQPGPPAPSPAAPGPAAHACAAPTCAKIQPASSGTAMRWRNK
jgi:hypothetical protein